MQIYICFGCTKRKLTSHCTAPGDDFVDLEDLLLALDAAVGRGPAGARRAQGGGVAEPGRKWFVETKTLRMISDCKDSFLAAWP